MYLNSDIRFLKSALESVVYFKQISKFSSSNLWHPIATPSPRLLRQCWFEPCLSPGYFLLQSSDCMLETCMLLAEGRRVLVIPIKAIGVGVGVYRKISLFLICLWLNNIASQYSSVFVVVFLSVINIRHH